MTSGATRDAAWPKSLPSRRGHATPRAMVPAISIGKPLAGSCSSGEANAQPITIKGLPRRDHCRRPASGHLGFAIHVISAAGTPSARRQSLIVTQHCRAAGTDSRPGHKSGDDQAATAGVGLPSGRQPCDDTHIRSATGPHSRPGHVENASHAGHESFAGVGPTSGHHRSSDTHGSFVAGLTGGGRR